MFRSRYFFVLLCTYSEQYCIILFDNPTEPKLLGVSFPELLSTMRLAVAAVRHTQRHSIRCFATKEKIEWDPVPPNYTLDSVKPPDDWAPMGEDVPPDPGRYIRNPVTSAHAIDIKGGKISARDSAAFTPSGTVVHGRYGDLGPDVAEGIPLEYLALLRPAAEGAAALRVISGQTEADTGTLLVYGASQPSAMAAVQLATAEGYAVVAVVGGEHAGNDEMVDCIKGMAAEPGTAVSEEYAVVKKNFADIVDATVNGDPDPVMDPDAYLEDFKKNLLDYAKAYPETSPAAVDEKHYTFDIESMHMKDADTFRDNVDAYLSQFKPGSPPIDPKRLDSNFTKDQYAVFRSKFNEQTTAVITGDPTGGFNPPQIVSDLIHTPGKLVDTHVSGEEYIPYDFNIFKGTAVPLRKGGPIMGAILAVTPGLEVAAAAVHKAGPSLRAKAEALQFLTHTQRFAYAAATSVVNLARRNNAPVYVVGGKYSSHEQVRSESMY